MSQRVGLLGGTFDPVHMGHLILAEEVRFQVGLDRVLFVPAGEPPHKLNESHSAPEHRIRMLELAIDGNPAFGISRVDLDRPGPHYSVDMVRLIQEERGPQTQLFFLMGLDSLGNLLTWHEPRHLIQQCWLVVANRPGYSIDRARILTELGTDETRVIFLSMPLIEIAAAELRRRVRAGCPIRYQVPEAVRQYIQEHGLYLS